MQLLPGNGFLYLPLLPSWLRFFPLFLMKILPALHRFCRQMIFQHQRKKADAVTYSNIVAAISAKLFLVPRFTPCLHDFPYISIGTYSRE